MLYSMHLHPVHLMYQECIYIYARDVRELENRGCWIYAKLRIIHVHWLVNLALTHVCQLNRAHLTVNVLPVIYGSFTIYTLNLTFGLGNFYYHHILINFSFDKFIQSAFN